MEVHHHGHAASGGARKKWTGYLWEFIMLFLAVTLGFFAENYRERAQDRSRVTEFMCKISSDLRSDIRSINLLKKDRINRNKQCDSLIALLTQVSVSTNNNRSKMYFYARFSTRRIHFRPQDATLQQLKNTGDLRLVENAEVLGAVNHYQQMLKYNEENVLVEEKELSDISHLVARLFDARVFQQMMNGDQISLPKDNPSLISYDKALLNELSVKLHYWKRTSFSVLESFRDLESEAGDLLNKISANYKCPKKEK